MGMSDGIKGFYMYVRGDENGESLHDEEFSVATPSNHGDEMTFLKKNLERWEVYFEKGYF